MLELIKDWIVPVTVAVLISAVLEMLLPHGSIKKYAKIAISIMIMLAVVAPLAGLFNKGIKMDFEKLINGSATQQTTLSQENTMSLYKDYVYEVYMRNKKNKNE